MPGLAPLWIAGVDFAFLPLLALALAATNHVSPGEADAIPVMGTAGIALADSVLFNMQEGGYISAHDRTIGLELANVLAGGRATWQRSLIDPTWVPTSSPRTRIP